jgi:hypothetical protein
MPSPSFWPIVVSFGLPVMAFGVIYSHILIVVGALIVIGGLYAWALEPATEPDSGDHGGDAAPSTELVSHG